jgi:electron transport complex protein RnfE
MELENEVLEIAELEKPDNKGKLKKTALGGIVENPVFRLVLGMCPTIVVTSTAMNALYMGIAVTFVLTLSNVIISLLKNVIDSRIRIPAYIVIIATLVTVVDMVMKKYMASMYENLKEAIGLIVVNCIVLGRAEGFAGKKENNVGLSAIDGLSMGLGYSAALIIIASIREVLGQGTIFGLEIKIIGDMSEGGIAIMEPIGIFGTLAGGMFMLGFTLAAFNAIFKKITAPKAPQNLELVSEEVSQV